MTTLWAVYSAVDHRPGQVLVLTQRAWDGRQPGIRNDQPRTMRTPPENPTEVEKLGGAHESPQDQSSLEHRIIGGRDL
jgi:hypothetical protein